MNNNKVGFEIVERIGIINEYETGWKKELNIVSWNGNRPKYDIRDWDGNHERMSRGITLTEKEMAKVKELISGRVLNEKSRSGREKEYER